MGLEDVRRPDLERIQIQDPGAFPQGCIRADADDSEHREEPQGKGSSRSGTEYQGRSRLHPQAPEHVPQLCRERGRTGEVHARRIQRRRGQGPGLHQVRKGHGGEFQHLVRAVFGDAYDEQRLGGRRLRPPLRKVQRGGDKGIRKGRPEPVRQVQGRGATVCERTCGLRLAGCQTCRRGRT